MTICARGVLFGVHYIACNIFKPFMHSKCARTLTLHGLHTSGYTAAESLREMRGNPLRMAFSS